MTSARQGKLMVLILVIEEKELYWADPANPVCKYSPCPLILAWARFYNT